MKPPSRQYNLFSFPSCILPRENFRFFGTAELCQLIDEAGRRAGTSRGQAFEDFLACSVCAVSNRRMEEEYLAVVRKGYGEGQPGRRGIDSLSKAFAKLIELMEETRQDIIGDLFEGGITYGEAGQFLTPECICQLMAGMTAAHDDSEERIVFDPCCGSGRMLLAYAEGQRTGELIGQDVDLRCVRMTSLNLGLRNLYGYVLWGNSLTGEIKLAYRTGMNMFGGFIRYMRPNELAENLAHEACNVVPETSDTIPSPAQAPGQPKKQLELF